MAWSEGEFLTTGYGELITVLDAYLVLNSNWSIYDDFSGYSPSTMISNGNFATNDFTSWTAGTGWAAGTGAAVKTAGSATTLTQNLVGEVVGATYKVTFDWTRTAGTLTTTVTNATGTNAISAGASGSATYYYYGATSTTSVLTFSAGSTFAGSVDNVVVTLIEENSRVYECDDSGGSGALFYVKVYDAAVGYATVELWAGWNATTHVGTGASVKAFSTTYLLRMGRPVGPWALSVKDASMRMIIGGIGTFIGRPSTVLETGQNVVMYCGSSSSGLTTNGIAVSKSASTLAGWIFLFDEDETQNLAFDGMSNTGGAGTRKCWQDVNGLAWFYKTYIVNDSTLLLVGFHDDIINVGAISTVPSIRIGQKFVAAGDPWIFFGDGSYMSAFKMD